MQNLKIYKKTPVMKNSALFATFSIAYIYVIDSFVRGVSAFNFTFYNNFLDKHAILILTLVLFTFAFFNGKKISKYIYLIFIFQCIYEVFSQYLIALDKFVLILNFFYIILCYYFYLFINSDLSEASSQPLYKKGDLYTSLTIDQKVEIHGVDIMASGEFVNWDKGTCFVRLSNDFEKLRGAVTLKWDFEGSLYESAGVVVTGAKDVGVGIRFYDALEIEGVFGWSEFYDIIQARGYLPYLTA